MMIATVTSKGQVTIPKAIRQYLHIETGLSLQFLTRKEGVLIKPIQKKSVKELRGILKNYRRPRPVSLEEMDRAILETASSLNR